MLQVHDFCTENYLRTLLSMDFCAIATPTNSHDGLINIINYIHTEKHERLICKINKISWVHVLYKIGALILHKF